MIVVMLLILICYLDCRYWFPSSLQHSLPLSYEDEIGEVRCSCVVAEVQVERWMMAASNFEPRAPRTSYADKLSLESG
jgi:hypothetical protein